MHEIGTVLINFLRFRIDINTYLFECGAIYTYIHIYAGELESENLILSSLTFWLLCDDHAITVDFM